MHWRRPPESCLTNTPLINGQAAHRCHTNLLSACEAYMAWHTIQALTSHVRGILSSQAIFQGVGVGSQVRVSSAILDRVHCLPRTVITSGLWL